MWIIKFVSSIALRKKDKDEIQRAKQLRISYKLFF
jgi:hypothetical protein